MALLRTPTVPVRAAVHPIALATFAVLGVIQLVSATEAWNEAQKPSPPARAAKSAAPEKLKSEHLPNALRVHEKVISGGMPEGDAAFRELRDRGIKTVISVDGAKPDVELAKKYGLRYVHLPHGYDGVPEDRAQQLAKAVRDLPGPIYIHCHHGKHRSPAAAAVACVSVGLLDSEAALQVLKVAGTSPNYRGLYQSAESAQRLDARTLDALPADFPAIAKLPPMAEAMVAVEHQHDHLKLIAKAGWKTPADHPALVPAHEALLLREHFTELLRTEETRRRPEPFQRMLKESEAASLELEKTLRAGGKSREFTKQADGAFERISQGCVSCHKEFRDVPLREKQGSFMPRLRLAPAQPVALAPSPPNVVLIFADDLGYADLSCFGATGYSTPNLDRLAASGVRLTDFHTPAAVCSASRAALLTGCYPQRVGILGALGPRAKIGINPAEVLLPEMLQARGYATAIYGKWHLGDSPQFLPGNHGFDDYFGLPYSNDMWPNHPTSKNFPPLPLLAGDKTLETNPDQTRLTTWYTERAVKFIEDHREQPFFLYVPHSMPHVPLFVSDKFRDKSGAGLYGDVIQEIDWSVGQILAALDRAGVADRTVVWFTSDNGPWLSYGNHAGSAGPLREGKGTTWEGGQRVPAIVRWPGQIPAGTTCSELTSTMDVYPTIAKLAGGELPAHKIDGHDIGPLLRGEAGAKSPYDAFYYYWDYRLEAVRSGPWKLHFPHGYRSLKGEPGKDGRPGPYEERQIGQALYQLDNDIGERNDVAAAHPDIVKRLEQLAERARHELGDSLTKRQGAEIRPAGRVAGP